MNVATWLFGRGREDQAQKIFLAALNLAIADAESARAEVRQSLRVQQWRERLHVRISVAAGGTSP